MSINRKNADGTYTEVAGVPYVTKENIGLGKVENKSPEEIVAMSLNAMNYVTPQMYGAKADGKTDDSDALENCFNSGKTVFIPNGIYIVSKDIIVDTDNTNVICESPKSIIKTSSNFQARTGGIIQFIGHIYDVEDFTATEPRRNYASWKSGTIDGSSVADGTLVNGLGFGRWNNICVEGLTTVSIAEKSITLQVGCDNIMIKNCKLENRSYANISLEQCKNAHITDCEMTGFRGISTYDSHNILFENCWVHNVRSFTIDINGRVVIEEDYRPDIDHPALNINVINCRFEDGNNLRLTNCVAHIENCVFKNNSASGIYYCTDAEIINCDGVSISTDTTEYKKSKNIRAIKTKFRSSNPIFVGCDNTVFECCEFENSVFHIYAPVKNVMFNSCRFNNDEYAINSSNASNCLPIMNACWISGENRKFYQGYKPIYTGLVVGNTLITPDNEITT